MLGNCGCLFEIHVDEFYQAKAKKNIETDLVGDKMGRIHLGRQNLDELQTRKMKGLKRGRNVEEDGIEGVEEASMNSEDEDGEAGSVEVKRAKVG